VISVLDFVNHVRALTATSPLPGLPLLGTQPDDEERDVLGSALSVSVGASEHPDWSARGRWVMRFHDASTAQRVATALGQEWLAEPPEVVLPDALVDLAVSEHYDVVVEDDEGWVRGWWAPAGDDGLPEFLTPSDPLVPFGGTIAASDE
jgi:hypothetical protein